MATKKPLAKRIPRNPYKPGTAAFGQEASRRADILFERIGKGNLRLTTAYQRAKKRRDELNKQLAKE